MIQVFVHLLMTTRSLGISHSSRVRTDIGVKRPKARILSSVALIFISYLQRGLVSFLLHNSVSESATGCHSRYSISRGFTEDLTGSIFSDQENRAFPGWAGQCPVGVNHWHRILLMVSRKLNINV